MSSFHIGKSTQNLASQNEFWLFRKLTGLQSVALLIALVLIGLLVVPVGKVIFVAFQDPSTGAATLQILPTSLQLLYLEKVLEFFLRFGNVGCFATIIALPLAYITTRFHFSGSILIQSLGFIPLIMPPFVGAVAMQLIFGRNGTVNLLLREKFSFSVPFMEGLNGVILVQSIHYFPFILINLSASLRNIDRSMEEAAQT